MMKMMTTDAVKICFENEVHRVPLRSEDGSTLTFQRLISTLYNLFPSFAGKIFSLTWQDDEGDTVICSSDAELDDAILVTQSKGKSLRFTVQIKKDEVNNAGAPFVHVNVTCDECGVRPIVGTRYKHTVCQHYNYCETCEQSRQHTVASVALEGRRMSEAIDPYDQLSDLDDFTVVHHSLPQPPPSMIDPAPTAAPVPAPIPVLAPPSPPLLDLQEGLRSILCLLNGVACETVEKLSPRLIQTISGVMRGLTTEEERDHARRRIGDLLLDVSTKERLFSKMFAELYCNLARENPWLAKMATEHYKGVHLEYEQISVIDPDTNYDGYCLEVKRSGLRCSKVSFYLQLERLGVLKRGSILILLRALLMKILTLIHQKDKLNLINELMNSVAILFEKDIIMRDVEGEGYGKEKQKADGEDNLDFDLSFVKDAITQLTRCKPRDYPGISSRTTFTLQDMLRKYN